MELHRVGHDWSDLAAAAAENKTGHVVPLEDYFLIINYKLLLKLYKIIFITQNYKAEKNCLKIIKEIFINILNNSISSYRLKFLPELSEGFNLFQNTLANPRIFILPQDW